MRVADLSPELKTQILSLRFDRIVEKHEGPFPWDWYLDEAEFLDSGRTVLLPVPEDQHKNITILRTIPSEDGNTLTIFLKDVTFCEGSSDEIFSAYLAVADRFPGHDFFLASVYHEWFLLPGLEEQLANPRQARG